MRSILLVSHGTLAKGVFEAANMIYGELENVQYLCLDKNTDIESFKVRLNELIEGIKDSKEIIVLADLKGGSPYTATVTLLSEKALLAKSKVISGLNLPLILSVLFISNDIGQTEVKDIIDSGREGIEEFEVENNNDEDL